MTMAWSYLAYAAGSIALTVWVGRTLKKHGAVLLSGGEEGELEGGRRHQGPSARNSRLASP